MAKWLVLLGLIAAVAAAPPAPRSALRPRITASHRRVDLTADKAHQPVSGGTPGGSRARSTICLLLLLTRVFQASMRNCINLLLVFISKEMEIGTLEKGKCLSAIPTGYLLTQVPGGALADRFGAKTVTTLSLTLSACGCLAMPWMAGRFGLTGLWFTLFFIGAVQGPLFPASTVFLSRWMPTVPGGVDEKAWGTSMLDIGISLGTLLVIPVANGLGASVGWQQTYRVIGLASLCFVALWQCVAANTPSQCWFIGEGERDFLQKYVAPPTARAAAQPSQKKKVPDQPMLLGIPRSMALSSGLWAVFLSHMAFNFGGYYLTNWSPTYYDSVLGLTPKETRAHLMLPHVANLAMKSISPFLVQHVSKSGYSLLTSRKLFTVTGYIVAALSFLPAHLLKSANPWCTTALFTLANSFFAFAPNGFRANYLDITRSYVGIVSGYGNTLGTCASWLGPMLVAQILSRTGSWHIVLGTVASSNLLAALNYAAHATVDSLEE